MVELADVGVGGVDGVGADVFAGEGRGRGGEVPAWLGGGLGSRRGGRREVPLSRSRCQ